MTDRIYTCNICETAYDNVEDYVKCVTECGKKLEAEKKAQAEKERIEKVNAALNAVKQAKAYYEEQLEKFKKEYPVEYKLNFGGKEHNCTCGGKCDNNNSNKNNNKNVESIALTYKNNGKDTPKVSAKINGEKVKDEQLEKLFSDPEVKYLAKMLGIL